MNLVLCILVLALAGGTTAYGFTPNTDPSLAALWKLDEGSGTTAADSSGNGNTGTLTNGPVWVAGQIDGALQFDGSNDYVACGNGASLNLNSQVTLAAWINPNTAGNGAHQIFVAKGDNSYALKHNTGNYMEFNIYDGTWYTARGPAVTAATFNGVWHHVAGTYDGTTLKIYINGELQPAIASESHTGDIDSSATAVSIGRDSDGGGRRYFNGLIDDVRIYSRALTVEEIQAVMTGGGNPALALAPVPQDKATDVPRDVVLAWTPGPYAVAHNVYLGTTFDDVNGASIATPLNVLASAGQDTNAYDPPGVLAYGQTYYWRVDEVNAAPDNTVHKGNIWSFTVEPFVYQVENVVATASCPNDVNRGPEKTVNGSGLTDGRHGVAEADMWLGAPAEGEAVWLQFDFDRVYKLHEARIWNYNMMYEIALGFSLKDITIETTTDGETWTVLRDLQLARGPGLVTYAGQSIDLEGIAAQSVRINVASNYGGDFYGLSEIRFYYIPAHPREPQPAAGATGVGLTPTLSWRAGREAVSHEVSFGTDQQAVADGTAVVDSVGVASYGVGPLDLGKTYYWKVDEVNQAEAISTWSGDVWNFTTQQYTVIDNIESYTEDEGNEVFSAWVDGYQINDNGSVVGYEEKPYVEKATVRSGAAAMPISYDNSGTASVSTAKRTFAGAQDWTQGGASILRLFFRGNANNNPSEPMWVRLTDQSGKSGTVTYGTGVAEGTDNQTIAVWHEWSIPLAQFGVNLTKVASMTIGFGGSGPRSSGLMLFDDIRLYPDAPASTPVLAAYWALNGNAQDGSGNGNDGALMGGATWAATGKFGGALSLNGTDAYVDCGNGPSLNITEAITLSAWVNTADANNAQHNPFVGKGDQAYAIKHNASNQIESFIYDGAWYTATYSINASFNGAWHHVASTYDGLHLRLYVDGVLRRTVSHTGSIATTTYNVNLGRNSQNTDRLYNGLIDEVRIYDGVLPPAEIVDLAKP
jgi:hypothetical protein